ncbi:MAG: DNA repair protein RecN, partial [Candidatus Kapabacteria bacterium]|nr:DNA repair protein RecN [Candidatus Kapabacteria bacterium]
AALADTHIAVEKSESKNRVTVSAKVLDKKERVREVAKLLSGETITDATLKSARELIAVGEK